MLLVVAIIGILVALLFPAMNSARKKAKRATAQAEVLGIERAWKSYLDEYLTAPTANVNWRRPPDAPIASPTTYLDYEKNGFVMTGKVARLLQGISENGDNPKRLRFAQFRLTDASGSPRNPWGGSYYVKIDYTLDDKITAGTSALTDPPARDMTDRRVIVWTYDTTVKSIMDTNRLISSWGR